jgi:CRISP-associated protein Cas1
MHPLYLIQQGAKIRIANRRLQVELDSEILVNVPVSHISQVVLFGNISLTTPAIAALLDQGSEVVFLKRAGEFRGRLTGSLTPHVPLRRAQYARTGQADFGLEMAKGFTKAKLKHMRVLLLRHNRSNGDGEIEKCVQQIRAALDSIPNKTSVSGLLGLEGSASAAYFRGFRRLFGQEWNFRDRNRRPPRDAVNVLLSFGYTLLTQLATSAVQTCGLDPYAGFLHELAYNRPSLGLDLAEEFRPVIDGIVLWCCNSGAITPANFSPGPAERPVVLDDAGRRSFLAAYENRLEQRFTHPGRGMQFPLRQCLYEQARQIANRIMDGPAGYQGMGFK